jgi:hypothetical protein
MHHHDDISAAIIGKLNYLGRQAESDIVADPTLLLTTQKRGMMCTR